MMEQQTVLSGRYNKETLNELHDYVTKKDFTSKFQTVNIGSLKALIIDDSGYERAMMKELSKSIGLKEVETASDGIDAINKISRNTYDIILCDYNLGSNQKNGQQVLEEAKMRDFIGLSNIFIIITGDPSIETLMSVIEYQPNDYIVKPISKGVIDTRIRKLLRFRGIYNKIDHSVKKKDWANAIEICDHFLDDTNGEHILTVLNIKGSLYLKIAQYAKARALYEEILGMVKIPWALYGLGVALFYEKDYIKSKETFERLIALNKLYVEAYDWIAKICIELKDTKEAEEMLLTAVRLSPRSIQLARRLAYLALNNGNYDTAVKSFNSAITNGKNSFLRDYKDYIGLSKALISTDEKDKALKTLEMAVKEYKDDRYCLMHTNMIKAVIYLNQGLAEDGKNVLKNALEMYNNMIENVSQEACLDMANALYLYKDKKSFTEIIHTIIGNNTDNESILSTIKQMFNAPDIKDEIDQDIAKIKEKINSICNKCAALVKNGSLPDALKELENTLKVYPQNMTLNLRAASIYIMYMQKQGVNTTMSIQTGVCLNRIKQRENLYQKYLQLSGLYENMLK